MFIQRPHRYVSLILCTAFADLEDTPTIFKNYAFYILRAVIYSVVFVVGNFYVTEVLYMKTLDKIAFLVGNVVLIALTVYIMLWSVVYKRKYVSILVRFKGENLQLQEWIEVLLLLAYLMLTCGTVAYESNNVYLVLEFGILFVLPDMLTFSAVYHFANLVTVLRRRFIQLNRDTLNGSDLANNIIGRYQALYKITVEVNNLYGLLILWTIVAFFIWMMIDLYRFLNDIMKDQVEEDGMIFGNLIATVYHYFTLFYIVILCSSTKLHCYNFRIFYLRTLLRQQPKIENKRICLSLFHQNAQFSALDWFEIDYPLLYGVSGAIVTYLVLLQQLHL
ncbi:uncharacterized protein LOC116167478 [Photinus pyralis]|uniref:uncharacterized protein LOC116160581 n=1 Tax=Photinus pyralis TaxID=7054 RepID=UPI0012675A09|nr:uncharacterized protein LOC116160581 [Photinus pyralis]XP_031329668.1 uncharacterized protein LOC116160581 [Photinus pyralis]XP_031329669.1 uncharacterized protein LOC116160581 [Photinus pyralis]XP_031329670.1 uncharacterized protein LOC116160581 [Photinus pyralis]XP_031338718.1 uncharacterized protein LOC116167478 [Photinus pyralis]XP_031338719.1 uncharacterized protein LOC116167478 [Photinus pyralis]XP_031338720.1 uncharacterized protein LOC116167478 [Photinus pyralis]XP_031338721.1 unc